MFKFQGGATEGQKLFLLGPMEGKCKVVCITCQKITFLGQLGGVIREIYCQKNEAVTVYQPAEDKRRGGINKIQFGLPEDH